jgi:hypothetical protein
VPAAAAEREQRGRLGGRLTAEAFECGSGKLRGAQSGGGEVRNVVRALLRVSGMEMEERGRGWAGRGCGCLAALLRRRGEVRGWYMMTSTEVRIHVQDGRNGSRKGKGRRSRLLPACSLLLPTMLSPVRPSQHAFSPPSLRLSRALTMTVLRQLYGLSHFMLRSTKTDPIQSYEL